MNDTNEIKQEKKCYKKHLIVFMVSVCSIAALAFILPLFLHISERTIERSLLAVLAVFLVFFLGWLKKS